MSEGVNPKDLIGAKKAPLRLVPPALTIEVARVMKLGAEKYGPYNWREYSVKLSVYLEAMLRHLLAAMDGEWEDPESGAPHVAHIAAGVAILLDAEANGSLIVDWPVFSGPAAALLAEQAPQTVAARSDLDRFYQESADTQRAGQGLEGVLIHEGF